MRGAIVGAMLMATACSNQRTDTPDAAPAPAVRSDLHLRILAESSPSAMAFQQTVKQYEQTTGIRVDLVTRPHADLQTAMQDDAPPFDLLIVPHTMLGQLVEAGQVQPIDRFLEKGSAPLPETSGAPDFFASSWTDASWVHGVAYGYPFELEPMSLWYREDLFGDEDEAQAFERRYGRPLALPRSPSELVQVAEFFHRPADGLFGTVIPGHGDRLWAVWLQYLALFGAGLSDVNAETRAGRTAVVSDAAVRATEFYLGLRQYSPPDTNLYDEHDAALAFERRKVAIGILPHRLAFAGAAPGTPRVVGGISYAPVRSASGAALTMVLGQTLVMSARSGRAGEAFSLMQWAVSDEAQVLQLLNGGLAVRSSSFTDPRVKELPGTHQSQPFAQIWALAALLTPPVRLATPTEGWAESTTQLLSSALAPVLAGDVPVRAGLAALARQLPPTDSHPETATRPRPSTRTGPGR